MTATAALVLALLLAPLPALAAAEPGKALAAADPAAEIAAGAAEAAETGKALEAATARPRQVAALGKAIEAYDAALSRIRAGIGDAAAREAALARDLADHRGEIARLLGALEAISRTPPPQQALHPQGPLGAARAAAMMDRLSPALSARAAELTGQLAALTAAREVRARGEADLAAALPRLDAARSALSQALAAAVPDQIGPADPTATMMARDSASLTALAAALAKTAGAPQAPAPAAAPPGAAPFVWPAAGQVIHHFNEPDAAGVRRPGIVLAAAPFTLVTAPADAVVRYAGPFLEYGAVVVLEPDSATLLVLAGLDRLQVRTGAEVRKGDLLGLLGGAGTDVEETVMSSDADRGSGAGETLYIEVRHGQGPVDPEPLFSGEDG